MRLTLDPDALARWQRGQVAYLEEVVLTNLPRISEAMKLSRSWAAAKELSPSETNDVARTPSRQTLRFSKSGNPTIEKLYRVCRGCAAHAPGQGEKRQARRGGALQQDAASL
jgi:hypothetical protein